MNPEEFLSQIRAEHEGGRTIACLSERHGKSQRQIHRDLRRAGTTMRAPGLPRLIERIIELGNAGHRPKEIAIELDCDRNHVSRVLVAHGMRTRQRRM